jgi:hypothetical protein
MGKRVSWPVSSWCWLLCTERQTPELFLQSTVRGTLFLSSFYCFYTEHWTVFLISPRVSAPAQAPGGLQKSKYQVVEIRGYFFLN